MCCVSQGRRAPGREGAGIPEHGDSSCECLLRSVCATRTAQRDRNGADLHHGGMKNSDFIFIGFYSDFIFLSPCWEQHSLKSRAVTFCKVWTYLTYNLTFIFYFIEVQMTVFTIFIFDRLYEQLKEIQKCTICVDNIRSTYF